MRGRWNNNRGRKQLGDLIPNPSVRGSNPARDISGGLRWLSSWFLDFRKTGGQANLVFHWQAAHVTPAFAGCGAEIWSGPVVNVGKLESDCPLSITLKVDFNWPAAAAVLS
jgi:hypothetical protein